MTTSEFIKMLQEADPSGNAHIRMHGGVPRFAELKEGYWDGPYNYIDENGNYVLSSEGMKVDIHCTDMEQFIEDNFDLHDPDNWKKIKKKFKFKLTNARKQERIDSTLKYAEKEWKEEYECEKRSFDESEERAIKNTKNGWTWFQNKLVDDDTIEFNTHHYYTWKIYDENGKEEFSNVYNVQGAYKSKLFERLDNDVKPGYYQWVLK